MVTSKDKDGSGIDPAEEPVADDSVHSKNEIEPNSSETTSSEDAAPETESADEEELPEWEPLTPELVEDEAIRGDFMLRWAVVLLALLLGFTQIAETATLVHVKTGQYIASHGWLPPANDVFSYTANDRPWTNLSWLFDVLLSGVFSGGGASALTLMKAVLAAAAFCLVVHSKKRDISTWWGAICAALALLVCYPQFTARPELVTIVGIACTLWLLVRWREGGSPKNLWVLPGLFLVWSNLDPHMFFGLALLLLYVAGMFVDSLRGKSNPADIATWKQLGIVTIVCVVASLLNPFGVHSLTAGFSLYGTEYPALRQFYSLRTDSALPPPNWQFYLQNYPMLSAVYWKWLSHHSIAGLMLIVATSVVFVLNKSRLETAHVFAALGFLAFALAGSHELAIAR